MGSFSPNTYSNSTWWIDRGVITTLPISAEQQPFSELNLPFRVFRLVRICISAHSTSVRWDIDRAEASSLDAASGFISNSSKPVRLEFFKGGWAFETYESADQAARRFDQLRRLRNCRLNTLTMIEPRDANNTEAMSPLLQRAIQFQDTSIQCHQLFYEYDKHLDDFILTMAGPISGLAQAMGPEWVEEAMGSAQSPDQHTEYDQTLVPSYFEVMNSGNNHHDSVATVISPPDQEQFWARYQRLIQPLERDGICTGVRVTCQTIRDRFPLLPSQ